MIQTRALLLLAFTLTISTAWANPFAEPKPPFYFQVPPGWSLARAAFQLGHPHWIYAPGTPAEHQKLENTPRQRVALYRQVSLTIESKYCHTEKAPTLLANELVRLGQLRKKQGKKKDQSRWVTSLLPIETIDIQAIYQENETSKGQLKSYIHLFTLDGKTMWRITYEGLAKDYDKNLDKTIESLQSFNFPKKDKK